jgi:hypothetical protein
MGFIEMYIRGQSQNPHITPLYPFSNILSLNHVTKFIIEIENTANIGVEVFSGVLKQLTTR